MNVTRGESKSHFQDPIINEMIELLSYIEQVTNKIAQEKLSFESDNTIARIIKKISKGMSQNTLPDFSKLKKDISNELDVTSFIKSSSYQNVQDAAHQQNFNQKQILAKFLEAMILKGSKEYRISAENKWVSVASKEQAAATSSLNMGFIPNSEWFDIGKVLLGYLIPEHPIEASSFLTEMIDFYEDGGQECLIFFNNLSQIFFEDNCKNKELLENLTWLTSKIFKKYPVIQKERKEGLQQSLSIVVNCINVASEVSHFQKEASKRGIQIRKKPDSLSQKQKQAIQKFKNQISSYRSFKKKNPRKENLAYLTDALEILKGMKPSHAELWKELVILIDGCKNESLRKRVWEYFKSAWEKNFLQHDPKSTEIWLALFKAKIIPEENELFSFLEKSQNWQSVHKLFHESTLKGEFYNLLIKKGINFIERNKLFYKEENIFGNCCSVFIESLKNLSIEMIDKDIRINLLELIGKLLMIVKDPKNNFTSELKAILIKLIIEAFPYDIEKNKFTIWAKQLVNYEVEIESEYLLNLLKCCLPYYLNSNSPFFPDLFNNIISKFNEENLEDIFLLLSQHVDADKLWWAWTRITEIKFEKCKDTQTIEEFKNKFLSSFNFFEKYIENIGMGKKIIAEKMTKTCIDALVKFESEELFLTLFNHVKLFFTEDLSHQIKYYDHINEHNSDPTVVWMTATLIESKSKYKKPLFLVKQASELFLTNADRLMKLEMPQRECIFFINLFLTNLVAENPIYNYNIDFLFRIISHPIFKNSFNQFLKKYPENVEHLNFIFRDKFRNENDEEKLLSVFKFFLRYLEEFLSTNYCEIETLEAAFKASLKILRSSNNIDRFKKISDKLHSCILETFEKHQILDFNRKYIDSKDILLDVFNIYSNVLVEKSNPPNNHSLECVKYIIKTLKVLINKNNNLEQSCLAVDRFINVMIMNHNVIEKYFLKIKKIVELGCKKDIYKNNPIKYLVHRNLLQLHLAPEKWDQLPPLLSKLKNNYHIHLKGIKALMHKLSVVGLDNCDYYVKKCCFLLINKFYEGFVLKKEDADKLYSGVISAFGVLYFTKRDTFYILDLVLSLSIFADPYHEFIGKLIEVIKDRIHYSIEEKQLDFENLGEYIKPLVLKIINSFKNIRYEKITHNYYSKMTEFINILSKYNSYSSFKDILVDFSSLFIFTDVNKLSSFEQRKAFALAFKEWLSSVHPFYSKNFGFSPLAIIGGKENFEKVFAGLEEEKALVMQFLKLISKEEELTK